MTLTIESRSDYVLVSGCGLSTLVEAQEHFRDLSAVLTRWRLKRSSARVLVDLRAGAPQTKEVSEHIEKASALIYRGDDRVAVVVSSTLLKLQIQRIHTRPNSCVFVSQEAAVGFLLR